MSGSREPPKTPPTEEKNLVRDEDQDDHTQPGIPRPGQQEDQQQQPFAPPQSGTRRPDLTSQALPSAFGNPDLNPAGMAPRQRIDLRDPNPLEPQGMLFDPRQLHDFRQDNHPRHPDMSVPPGARFDPFGPPDDVGPGRGPRPDLRFANPDPDHELPPGQLPQLPGKTLKGPWPPGPGRGPRDHFPPPGGAGGSPFI